MRQASRSLGASRAGAVRASGAAAQACYAHPVSKASEAYVSAWVIDYTCEPKSASPQSESTEVQSVTELVVLGRDHTHQAHEVRA